jgi:5-formyltetrahydrofolate cyclo-ligase
VPETKAELRARVRAVRSSRTRSEREDARVGVTKALLDLCSKAAATTVAAFLPTPTEPPIDAFLEAAHRAGITVLVPIAHPDGSLTWTTFAPELTQTRGALGVPEIAPSPGAEAEPERQLAEAELILVPAAAVDTHGTRLGWGKGFYDRALAALPRQIPTFAVVFDDEVFDALPREAHDEPVSGAVTPARTLRF